MTYPWPKCLGIFDVTELEWTNSYNHTAASAFRSGDCRRRQNIQEMPVKEQSLYELPGRVPVLYELDGGRYDMILQSDKVRLMRSLCL
jgi:hypothetical protein